MSENVRRVPADKERLHHAKRDEDEGGNARALRKRPNAIALVPPAPFSKVIEGQGQEDARADDNDEELGHFDEEHQREKQKIDTRRDDDRGLSPFRDKIRLPLRFSKDIVFCPDWYYIWYMYYL